MAKTIVKTTRNFIIKTMVLAIALTCIVSVMLSYGLFSVLNH